MVFRRNIHHPAVENQVPADEREAHENQGPTRIVYVVKISNRRTAKQRYNLIENTIRAVNTFSPNQHRRHTGDNAGNEHGRSNPTGKIFIANQDKQERENQRWYDTEEQVRTQEEEHVPDRQPEIRLIEDTDIVTEVIPNPSRFLSRIVKERHRKRTDCFVITEHNQ